MATSPVSDTHGPVRCPSCGSERVHLRAEPDRIDPIYQTTSDRVKRVFVKDMQLYHCFVCRLQFYDVPPDAPAQAAAPAVPALPATEAAARSAESTRIGETVLIRGRLSSEEAILVSGEIIGDLEMLDHTLTVAPTGRIYGDVIADVVTVFGILEGSVQAAQKLTLAASSTMTGEILTPTIKIEDGAYFKGRIETA